MSLLAKPLLLALIWASDRLITVFGTVRHSRSGGLLSPDTMIRIKQEDRNESGSATPGGSTSTRTPYDQQSQQDLDDAPTEPSAHRIDSEHPLLQLRAQFAMMDEQRNRESRENRRSDPRYDSRRAPPPPPRQPRPVKRTETPYSESSHRQSSRPGASSPGKGDSEEDVVFQSAHRRYSSLAPSGASSQTRSNSPDRSSTDRDATEASTNTSYDRSTPPEDETPATDGDNRHCRCPIHLDCGIRGGRLIDCRILVPIWKKWKRSQQAVDPWA